MSENNSEQQGQENSEQASEFTPIQSQEDFDRLVAKRLDRERRKFSDYDDLKAKASKFDEFEDQQKSELQRVQDELEAERKARADAESKAAGFEVARSRAAFAADAGVPASLLHGDDEDGWKQQAADFKTAVGERPGYAPGSGTGDPSSPVERGSGRSRAQEYLAKNKHKI